MKIIIVFYLISGLVSSTDVIGYSGCSIIMATYYSRHRWNWNSAKFICKVSGRDCINVVYSSAQSDRVSEGRFSLYKDKHEYFVVFIRELNLRDTGVYKFGLEYQSHQEINLKLEHDAGCMKPMTVIGHLNKAVSFSCDYKEEHKEKWKVLYKLNGHSADIVIYTYHGTNYEKERFKIFDDVPSNRFTVDIHHLKEVDGGVYFCGVQNWESSVAYISTVKTVHLRITDKVQGSVRVIGFLGGHVMMKCQHPLDERRARFFCKESRGECPERTYASVQNEWQQNKGFSLYDDTSRESLIVFLRNLSEGTYRCGVDVSEFNEQYIEVNVEVKEEPCCGKTISQAGYIGDTVTITCEYPRSYRADPKHFCKEDENHICQDISPLRDAGRYSLSNHSQPGFFTVTISNLTLGDAGVYWCGVETIKGNINYTSFISKVQISIIASRVTGLEGEAIEIGCPYESKYKQNLKHLCKEECLTHLNNSLTSQWPMLNKPERFSVHDNITTGVFSVNISGVTADDAGKYWCGVETGDILVNYLSTELQVIMKEVLQVTGRETVNLTIECKSRRESVKSDGRFFCLGQQISSCDEGGVRVSSETDRNGRFSLSDDVPAGLFTVTITDLRVEDSGTYWCREESGGSTIYTKVHLQVTKAPGSSFIITVCVCVVLLLIGGPTLIFYKLRYRKTTDSFTSHRTDMVNNDGVPPVASDNMEINHARPQRDSDTSIYMNTLSATNSSDQNTGMCIYSTVQLPKDEGPTYATVSFQKNPDSHKNSTVTFVPDVSATEYATVRHHPRP